MLGWVWIGLTILVIVVIGIVAALGSQTRDATRDLSTIAAAQRFESALYDYGVLRFKVDDYPNAPHREAQRLQPASFDGNGPY